MKKPQLENWFLARASFVFASLFFAAFAVYYWAVPLWNESPALSIGMAVGFSLSALVTPAVMPKLARAKGWGLAGLMFGCFVFGCVDALGVSGGFAGLEKDLTQAEYDAAVTSYQAAIIKPTADIASAQSKLDGLPTMTAVCEGYGPINCEKRQAGLVADRDTFQGSLNAATATLSSIALPVRAERFNDHTVAILSVLIQIALAVSMLALEAARLGAHRRDMAAYETARAKAKVAREKKAKAKSRDVIKSKPTWPHLIASND